jgi:hypothetical protein
MSLNGILNNDPSDKLGLTKVNNSSDNNVVLTFHNIVKINPKSWLKPMKITLKIPIKKDLQALKM